MGIKPSRVQVYVEYECSRCGCPHGQYRIGEVKRFVCPECGRVDRVEPIKVDVAYDTGEHTATQITCNLQSGDVKNAKAVLRSLGYSGKQASLVLKRTISLHPRLKNYDELVKQAMIEAANVYSPTDDH